MKLVTLILFFGLSLASCNNNGSSKTTTDSSSINVNSGNVSDGGPNNGAGDTSDYSRMNDMVKDSSTKHSTPK